MSNVFDELSNEELREELVQRGVTGIGPIGPQTRKVYIRKLMTMAASGDADFNAPRTRSPLVDLTDEVELANEKAGDDMFEDVGDHEGTPDSETVETDTNGGPTEYVDHESDQSDYMETSRVLTPEEARQRFISPMAHRRKMVQKSQSRMQWVVMVALGVLTAYSLFYLLQNNMFIDDKQAIKDADSEL